MATNWYYAENGERRGPATSEEIVKLIGQDNSQPVMIWAEGIQLAAPSTEADTQKRAESKRATLARRARNELIEYMAIAGYLAVCFAALLFYKATILEGEGIATTRVALAIVKALILGKFVLILQSLKVGHGKGGAGVLFLDILKKALLFTLLLLVLSAAEEVLVGYFHGEAANHALKTMGGGTVPELIASTLLVFLILIPYFAYREIAAKLGEEKLMRLLFAREPLKSPARFDRSAEALKGTQSLDSGKPR
jgi:hypothetical protein